MSEELVIRQAAPTLAGIKTGSLFPCPCEDKAALLAEIRAFNRRYQARGLCLLPLRFTKGKALLYLYRPAALQRDLDSDAAAKLLAGAGYPCGSCGGCMAALRRTMAAGFRIEEAVTLERAQEEREALLLPLDEYFRAYPRFTVQNETQEKRAYNGNAFTARGVADGEYRVYDRAGNFLSLSRAEDGELHAIKNFF